MIIIDTTLKSNTEYMRAVFEVANADISTYYPDSNNINLLSFIAICILTSSLLVNFSLL